MLEFCTDLWSNIQEWGEDFSNRVEETIPHWKHYTQERAVFKGLPFAVIATIAATYLFKGATASQGAVFGVVNYITLTTLSEVLTGPRLHQDLDDKKKAYAVLGISGIISWAFVQTVFKTSMTHQTGTILTVAALAGQLARELLRS